MKKLTILFILFALFGTHAHAKFGIWLDKQLIFTHQMNEDNATQESVSKIAQQQDLLYDQVLEEILQHKSEILSLPKRFEKEIFSLKKMMALNKRLGNKYAVTRDEALLKSYTLMQLQDKMIKNIMRALDKRDMDKFEAAVYDMIAKNELEMQKIEDVDYKPILLLDEESKILREAQKNIKDYYALIEIHYDVLRRIVDSRKRIYRLNKYTKFKVLTAVLYINHKDKVETFNSLLKPYGLDVTKVIFIVFITLLIYLIRKVLYGTIKLFILKTKYMKDYATEILDDIRRPIIHLFFVINLEMILYIYHDFNSFATVDKVFNIIYAFFFTVLIYKTVNSIARVKIQYLEQSDKNVKNEMINIGVKLINMLIIIVGLLIMLHLSGANLTAVLSGLGIGGLAVALAARESLENFFGTISILMSDVYSQGDWIEADGKEGIVVEIGLRVTTVRTFGNALIAIPNATLANSDVKNWSKRVIGRKIKMTLGVKYDSKAENINNAVEEIREMLKSHPDIATENTMYQDRLHKSPKLVSKEDELGVKRTLLVYLDEFSDSSINILVYCFTKTTKWTEWLKTKEDVMYKIMEILERNSLEFAYPSMSLYHENEKSNS